MRAQQVAKSDVTVFVMGESGVGKELVSRYIHENGDRREMPFVAVNCAALPENLLESELFGYEKGAFTGAATRKPGKFELADGGTILLDEVTEMDLRLQAKLLRVLQEREVEVIGSRYPKKVNVKVIATTNRNINRLVDEGKFREDLYYRLNVFPIVVPPLKGKKGRYPPTRGMPPEEVRAGNGHAGRKGGDEPAHSEKLEGKCTRAGKRHCEGVHFIRLCGNQSCPPGGPERGERICGSPVR